MASRAGIAWRDWTVRGGDVGLRVAIPAVVWSWGHASISWTAYWREVDTRGARGRHREMSGRVGRVRERVRVA